MSINPKAIKTLDIQGAHDVVLAHLEANPDMVARDTSPIEAATAMIEGAMRTLNHAMLGNAGALITSGRAAVTRGKRQPATAETLRPEALAFATLALGGVSPLTATSATQAVEAPPVAPEAAMDTAAIDATISAIAGAPLGLPTLLAARDGLRAQQVQGEAALAAEPASVPVFQAGTPSGLADLPRTHALAPAVDALLAPLLPGTTWAGIVEEISALETTISGLAQQDHKRRIPAPVARVAIPSVDTPISVAPYSDAAATASIDATVRTILRPGSDLFPQAYGASMKLLGFDVTTLAFDTPHPEVPAIDPSYKFYVPVLVEAMQALVDNEILWIYGDSGCGKSAFWEQVAAYLGMPYTRMNMDGHLTRGDIIGVNRMVPNSERQMEMRFIDGILPRAMARPGLLLIDELDLGDPEIMAVFQPVLEGQPLRILEDHGRVVHPHPLFRIAVTGNTIGLGSDTNAYLNAFEQSAATRDRISAFVRMPYMTPAVEKAVLKERLPGIDEAFLDKLIQLANKVREGYANGKIGQIFSTRSTQAAARRYSRLAPLYPNPDEAVHAILETVILNRMDARSRAATKGLIDNIFA